LIHIVVFGDQEVQTLERIRDLALAIVVGRRQFGSEMEWQGLNINFGRFAGSVDQRGAKKRVMGEVDRRAGRRNIQGVGPGMASIQRGKRFFGRMQVMMQLGLVSITFRKLTCREIVDVAVKARLEGIEWGGDVHVPPGDAAAARQAKQMCDDAGLSVTAYGSYFRLGAEPVLETALAIKAPIIRIWAGKLGSKETDAPLRQRIVEEAKKVSALADKGGVIVATEWHGNTLTDTAESAGELFREVGHANFRTLWQPHGGMPFEECLKDFQVAAERLVGVHVFYWDYDANKKMESLPLLGGEKVWPTYLRKATDAGARFASLEFVRKNSPEQLIEDAAVLRRWRQGLGA
jgi:sugar phosphate isomerase/epimerase